MVKIFVIDSQAIFRHGLISSLDWYPDFQVVGKADNIQEAIDKITELQPNVVIMDAFLNGCGVEGISLLQQRCPKVRPFILTYFSGEENLSRAIDAGARGYLLKTASLAELVDAM